MWQLAQPALPANSLNPSTSWRRQRAVIAVDPAVEPGWWGHQRALVGRDRLGQIFVTDLGVLGKRLGKCASVFGVGGEPRNQRRFRLCHLVRRLNRAKYLLLEISGARRPRTPDAPTRGSTASVCGGRAAGRIRRCRARGRQQILCLGCDRSRTPCCRRPRASGHETVFHRGCAWLRRNHCRPGTELAGGLRNAALSAARSGSASD